MFGWIIPAKYPNTSKTIKNREREIRIFSAVTIFVLSLSSSVVRKNNANPKLISTTIKTSANTILNSRIKVLPQSS